MGLAPTRTAWGDPLAAGELVAVKEVGVGMTVAILLDVTIVRGLLLPAAMTLLGKRNWWRPARSRPHDETLGAI